MNETIIENKNSFMCLPLSELKKSMVIKAYMYSVLNHIIS